MSRVVIAASEGWSERLTGSVLWRAGVERVTAPDAPSALAAVAHSKVRLAVFDAAEPTIEDVLRRLREEPKTRTVSVVVLLREGTDERRDALLRAGANAVLLEAEGPATWDDRFEQLLGVPPRREIRAQVAITIWTRRTGSSGAAVLGTSVNVSVNGLLVEMREPLAVGTMLNLSFRLPTAEDELRLLGRVVWTAPGPAGASQSGIEFLGFHGRAMEAIVAFGGGT